METIEISLERQRTAPKNQERARRRRTIAQIAGTAAKAGLYIGTGIAVGRTIVWASDVAKGRLLIPGGEIFTIPLIVALLAVGWALRGDAERAIRQREREQRRRKYGRRQ